MWKLYDWRLIMANRRIMGTTGTRKLALQSAKHLRNKKFKGKKIFKKVKVTKICHRPRVPAGYKCGYDISLEDADWILKA